MTRRLSLLAALAIAVAACGDDEPAPSATTAADPAVEAPAGNAAPPAGGDEPDQPATGSQPAEQGAGPAEGPAGDPRVTELEREAARAVRAFVAALDARDGGGACALLGPNALAQIELPERRPGCAASLEASIGYRDPRGLPVWEGADVTGVGSVEVDGDAAKVVATVVTRFADRDEVSIEDDVVYLLRTADGWAIAKPSSTLYRAVGIADIPPSVLAPPDSGP